MSCLCIIHFRDIITVLDFNTIPLLHWRDAKSQYFPFSQVSFLVLLFNLQPDFERYNWMDSHYILILIRIEILDTNWNFTLRLINYPFYTLLLQRQIDDRKLSVVSSSYRKTFHHHTRRHLNKFCWLKM